MRQSRRQRRPRRSSEKPLAFPVPHYSPDIVRFLVSPARFFAAGVAFRVRYVVVCATAARTLTEGGGPAWDAFVGSRKLYVGSTNDDLLILLVEECEGENILIGLVHEPAPGSPSLRWTPAEQQAAVDTVLSQALDVEHRLVQ
jgi:hypothetical protein